MITHKHIMDYLLLNSIVMVVHSALYNCPIHCKWSVAALDNRQTYGNFYAPLIFLLMRQWQCFHSKWLTGRIHSVVRTFLNRTLMGDEIYLWNYRASVRAPDVIFSFEIRAQSMVLLIGCRRRNEHIQLIRLVCKCLVIYNNNLVKCIKKYAS